MFYPRLPRRGWIVALALAAIAILVLPAFAFAHEHRTIGDYELVVGWVNEPAYVDDANRIDLRVTNVQTKQPVEGLEKTIKVDIIYGGKTKTIALRPRFGQPGAYIGDVLPTRTGDYVFHFTGAIEGTPLDARFDSADGKFHGVQPKTEVAFPEPLVAAGSLQDRIAALDDRVAAAEASARLGTIVGGAGVLIGTIGLILAIVALRSTRRPTPAGETSRPVAAD